MKKAILNSFVMVVGISGLLLVLVAIKSNKHISNGTINSIIGDESYTSVFGEKPNESIDDQLRIKTHLSYVEGMLRSKDVSHLSMEEKAKRSEMLDLLHTYWQAEKYPFNLDNKESRRPCFYDAQNNICAVGYLVQQTAGDAMVQRINEDYKYSEIYEMNSPELLAWVGASGLTLKEVATIQPSYSPPSQITTGLGIGTAMWTGANLGLTAVNLTQGRDQRKIFPILNIASGLGQTTFGLLNYPYESGYWGVNRKQQNYALKNVGIGTSSVLVGSYRLLTGNRNLSNEKPTLDAYAYPQSGGMVGYGFTFRSRF